MTFDDLVKFLRGNWPAIVATAIIVTPVLWVILRYLFKQQIEVLRTHNDALKQKIELLERSGEKTSSSGADRRDDITELIGEWTRLIFETKTRHRRAMEDDHPSWPGESLPLVERENDLYTRILGKLDRGNLSQDRLVGEIRSFRELDDVADWSERRDRLMGMVGSAFRNAN